MFSNIEKIFPLIGQSHSDDDGTPRFLLGKDACVGALRKVDYDYKTRSGNQTEGSPTLDTMQPQRILDQAGQEGVQEEGGTERLLCYLKSTEVAVDLPLHYNHTSFSNIRGTIFVTTKRVFFVAHDDDMASFDFAINAYCISLHALMSEPTHSVYCQLVLSEQQGSQGDVLVLGQKEDEPQDDLDPPSAEVVIKPIQDGVEQGTDESLCQDLFNALTKLINLNPILDEDEDEGGMGFSSGSSGGLAAMFGLLAEDQGSIHQYDDEDADADDDDDLVYRIDSNQISKMDTTTMTIEESENRARMLSHLDSLLVVPPQFEITEGQFEDAIEDHRNSEEDI
mmetsp:Transcript_15811/g.29836  ORF Transcript_15811/g.29836 Transcript_15811/m.29836 type:complete len:338 (+) Transcript_15811:148-1161(+)